MLGTPAENLVTVVILLALFLLSGRHLYKYRDQSELTSEQRGFYRAVRFAFVAATFALVVVIIKLVEAYWNFSPN